MRLAVLVLEDEPGVRDALVRDLAPIADRVRVDAAEDVEDAWTVLAEIDADGDELALVLADHRLPGTTGVDFLVAVHDDPDTALVRTVLVTGQADLADTIRAVNRAGLHHYIAKPWEPDELLEVVRTQLTRYVIEADVDPLPHLPVLDAAAVMDVLRTRGDR